MILLRRTSKGTVEMVRIILSGTVVGTLSGLLLFFLLYYIDAMTDIELVRLLLNIDFIYSGDVHPIMEVGLHIVTSIIIGIIFKTVYAKFFAYHLRAHVFAALIFAGLYFLLSNIAVSPIRTDEHIGFILWMIFHVGYLQVIHLIYINQWDVYLMNKMGV